LFPYEDDALVRNFSILLDRKKMRWKSVANELDDPRIDKEKSCFALIYRGGLKGPRHGSSLRAPAEKGEPQEQQQREEAVDATREVEDGA
jgi:hypothetical protein